MRALGISVILALASAVASASAFGGCSSSPSPSDDGASEAEAGDASPTLKANGTLGLWQTLTPMPSPRANFCATVASGFVVAIGGNFPADGGFTKLDAVHVARFHDDGTLDPWQLAGHAPSPVTECTVTAAGSTLYLLDGIYDDTSKGGIVFTADLASDGTLSAFTQGPALPNADRLLDDLAFTSADRLYSLTSKISGSCASVSSPLASLSSWSDVDFLAEFRGRPQWASAIANNSLFGYVLGGYSDADSGNQVLATGKGVALHADGTAGASFDVTALPQPTTFGTAASADDWVFVIGGRDAIFGGTPRADIVSAQASSQGTLGAWTAQASLPSPRTNVAAVVAGNYLYVLGGASTQATDSVFAAQVRF